MNIFKRVNPIKKKLSPFLSIIPHSSLYFACLITYATWILCVRMSCFVNFFCPFWRFVFYLLILVLYFWVNILSFTYVKNIFFSVIVYFVGDIFEIQNLANIFYYLSYWAKPDILLHKTYSHICPSSTWMAPS